jgi:hypothetical protein
MVVLDRNFLSSEYILGSYIESEQTILLVPVGNRGMETACTIDLPGSKS